MSLHHSIIRAAIVSVLLGIAPLALAEEPAQDKPPLTADELRQYRKLSALIKENYVDPVDDQRLFNACLSGMSRLDPHSDYLDAEAYKNLSSDSGSAAVGLELQIKNHRAMVISVIEDSPAAQAGIRKGDSIFKIDGNIIYDVPLDKVVQQLRGKPDTTLLLTVGRDGVTEPITFNLTRKNIKMQTVKSRMLEPGYGYVRVSAFYVNTIDKFVETMQALDKQNGGALKGLVLDLRNNPGGRLDKALALAGAFLPQDIELMSTRGRAKNATHISRNNYGLFNHDLSREDSQALEKLPFGVKRVPLVVLANNGSAAGAEIVVGALQDYRRALIVGTPTFGKDSIQTLMTLSQEGAKEETALKLTTARWQTPNGRSSAPAGIAPDILIADTAEGSLQENDPTLDRALVSLKRGQAPEPIPGLDEKLIQKLLDNFYKYSPQMLDDLRKEAFAADKAHQTDKAIERWSKLLDEKPGDEQAFRARGALYAEQGKRDLAFADLLHAVEKNPNAASTRNAVCWSKILLGDFADAQSDCIKALALDPGNLAATVNLGHTWLMRDKKDDAWHWYEKALPLIESKDDLAELLADFDLFKKRGWQPKLSQAGRDWFAKQGKAWLARRAPADQLIARISAAEASKDTATELKLRIERLNKLEKLLFPTHPSVARAAYALADTHMQAKQPDQAVPLYLRMMNYLDDLDGNPPRGLITTINKITDALNAKEYSSKDTLLALKQMLDVMERHWGPDNQHTQSLVRRLAAESIEEKPTRALQLGKRALSYLEAHDAPVEKRIATTYTILKALQKLKLHGESIPYLEKLLALLNQDMEKNLKSIIVVTESLAGTHGLIDHPDQALTYYKQALKMQRNVNNGALNYEHISTLSKTGAMLSHFGRLDEATPYLEEAARIAEQLYGKDSPATIVMTRNLDEHKLKLEKSGKPEAGKAP